MFVKLLIVIAVLQMADGWNVSIFYKTIILVWNPIATRWLKIVVSGSSVVKIWTHTVGAVWNSPFVDVVRVCFSSFPAFIAHFISLDVWQMGDASVLWKFHNDVIVWFRFLMRNILSFLWLFNKRTVADKRLEMFTIVAVRYESLYEE